MVQTTIGILCALLLVASPVLAKNPSPGKPDAQPHGHTPAAEDPGYQAAKAALNGSEKGKEDKSLLDTFQDFLRGDPKTTFDQKQNRGHSTRENRGDPKTTFDQSENRFHSDQQTPPVDLPPVPDPIPDPVPDPVPDPTPTPEPALDLSTWSVANTFESGIYQLSVYFKPVEGGLYDVVLVVYDTTTGEAIQATGYRTTTVFEMPDLAGMILVLGTQMEDGSTIEKYALFAEDSASWEDVSMWVETHYDAQGAFLFATIKTIEALALDTVAIPPLETIS